MPVPLNEIVEGELVAVLTTLMLRATAPVVVGAKLAVSGKLWPAESVSPAEKPVTLNPAPAAATCEMLTLPVPVFVSVKACDAEFPTNMLPKLKLLALVESKYDCVCVGVAGVPVPEAPIEIGLPPLWPGLMTMLPLNVSAASGLNTTWNDTLLRGPMEMGIAAEITMNSGRLLLTSWMEVLWRLLFVTTTVLAPLVVLIVTDPKLSAVGVTPTPA